jgi:nucleotide-binding universal stress UspA family protein
MKSILLAVGGTTHSMKAAETAVSLGNDHFYHIVHVVSPSESKHDAWLGWDKEKLQLERKQKLKPITDLFDEKGLRYDVHFLKGEPSEKIIEFANAHPIDLIVVGSRGLNKFQEFVLGSVSQEVLHLSKVPVLIVK